MITVAKVTVLCETTAGWLNFHSLWRKPFMSVSFDTYAYRQTEKELWGCLR